MAVTPDALRKNLADLYSQPGVSGSCLQTGGLVMNHDLPYSDERVGNFAARVNHLVSGYESVDRPLWQICAGFENFRLLILSRGNTRLSVLLTPSADIDLVAARATRLLMELEMLPSPTGTSANPPVLASVGTAQTLQAQSETSPMMKRAEFEKIVTGLLSRVTGQAQAAKLIQRAMSKETTPINGELKRDDARRLGLAILDYVPNRGKRDALSSEFLNTFDS